VNAPIAPKANALLAALPEVVYRRLLPRLEATVLRPGEPLFPPDGNVEFAYFPTTSIVAVLYDVDSAALRVNAWPVGREGMLGISQVLGVPNFVTRAEVLIGGTAFRLPAASLLAELQRTSALKDLLLRYAFALITQASQLGVCSHYHTVEQQHVRFLLRSFDGVSSEQIDLTHQRIADLLGVRRVSITRAAGKLQADKLIEYVRGRVTLINRKKLEERSCVCTAIIRRAFDDVSGWALNPA
jgi:CRP-like cAMP-binding protein